MASSISRGALKQIYLNKPTDNPVLQCLQIKQLAKKETTDVDRHRTVFSDVDNFIQSMLGTSLNHLVSEEKLQRGSFVRITQWQTNEVKGKKIMIVLDCDVLEELGVAEKIGNPIALEDSVKPEDGATKQEPASNNGISGNNFYGAKQESQPQRSLPTRAGPTPSSRGNIYPIDAISPYAHNWTIKARCTYKSDIKQWHKQSGSGKLFSCNFLDETEEIRATGFNNECDAFYDLIQEGSVYYVGFPCQVKLANKKFSNLKNDYELTFDRGTVIEKAEDGDSSVPKQKFNFTNLQDIQNVEKDTTIDTIGVLTNVGEVNEIQSKTTGKPYSKRDLTLVDDTGYSIRLTVWGNTATAFETREASVVAFKGVKVSDFDGRSLSLLASGSMAADPDIDEAFRLKGWYEGQGKDMANFTSHASVLGSTSGGGRKDVFKTIGAVRDSGMGMNETAEYFTTKATVVYIKVDSTIAYPGCRSEGCAKKLVQSTQDAWRCESCDKEWDRPQYRYVLQANFSDHTGSLWISCFDSAGQTIIGKSADEMMDLKEAGDDQAYRAALENANCRTWILRCRAKMDTFQEQNRVRYQVFEARKLNWSAEADRLSEILKQYNLEGDQGLFVH